MLAAARLVRIYFSRAVVLAFCRRDGRQVRQVGAPGSRSTKPDSSEREGQVIIAGSSSWHGQKHRVQESLLLAALWVEGREGVGEAKEIGAAILLRREEGTESIRPPR